MKILKLRCNHFSRCCEGLLAAMQIDHTLKALLRRWPCYHSLATGPRVPYVHPLLSAVTPQPPTSCVGGQDPWCSANLRWCDRKILEDVMTPFFSKFAFCQGGCLRLSPVPTCSPHASELSPEFSLLSEYVPYFPVAPLPCAP